MVQVVAALRSLLLEWRYFSILALGLLLGEAALGSLIIFKVPYTEIDWVAYMQEVEGVANGTLDYLELRGDTGPLVYPGGFVGVFSALYWLTDRGADIGLAQWVWLGFYLATLALVLDIYRLTKPCPPWAVLLLALSKRIHSIFVLRLFNDCVAMLLLYASVSLFLRRRWSIGSLVFSAAVSVKMNVLLFAPGLFVLLMSAVGPAGAFANIALCALLQLAVGAPFLAANWRGYLGRAFELSRVFTYKWTVNWKFLDEETFVDKRLAALLLVAHALALATLLWRWTGCDGGPLHAMRRWAATTHAAPRRIAPSFAAAVLFTSNFVGIAVARTLHYQFYCWYFHSLPLLLWGAGLPAWVNVAMMAAVEVAYNVFPATAWSSALLQASHAVLLVATLARPWPRGCADAGPPVKERKRQ